MHHGLSFEEESYLALKHTFQFLPTSEKQQIPHSLLKHILNYIRLWYKIATDSV